VTGAIPLEAGLFLLAVLASAWFSAVEIALVSASPLRLRRQAKGARAATGLAVGLLEDRERALATTLVGINLSNLTAAAVATQILSSLLADRLGSWQVSAITTGAVTLVLLVFAEIVPKVYGKQRAEGLVAAAARPIVFTEQLLLPLSALVRGWLYLLTRILRRAPRRPAVTRDELKLLVHEVPGETGPGRKERKMLRSALDFAETSVREVMVAMPETVAIEQDSSCDLLRALVRRYGFTRLPVYERRIDKIIGLVNVFDLLFDPKPAEVIGKYIREAPLVPETKRIERLLAELQRDRQTMAVVVSEFGSCVGIVTLEDIVEEIFGELVEEHEVSTRKLRRMGPRTWMVDALTDIDDVNEDLGLELPKGRYDTVNGFVLRRLGRIPREGESFEYHGMEFRVVDAHRYGVRTVMLILPEGKRREDPE
jgi:CBS domain containing-hemolysin-like protein